MRPTRRSCGTGTSTACLMTARPTAGSTRNGLSRRTGSDRDTQTIRRIREDSVKRCITALIALGAIASASFAAQAQISDDVVKIGVLTDMSSVYADGTGKGSLTAAQ